YVPRARQKSVPRLEVVVYPDDVVMKAERPSRAVEHRFPHRAGTRRIAQSGRARDRLELGEVEPTEHDAHVTTGHSVERRSLFAVAHEYPRRRLTSEVASKAQNVRDRVGAGDARNLGVVLRGK